MALRYFEYAEYDDADGCEYKDYPPEIRDLAGGGQFYDCPPVRGASNTEGRCWKCHEGVVLPGWYCEEYISNDDNCGSTYYPVCRKCVDKSR